MRAIGSTKDKSSANAFSTGNSNLGSSRNTQGEKSGQNIPKRGDEGDFIPLVDMHDNKSTHNQFGVAVSEADSYDSDRKHNYHAR